jgi:hypothetical protein
VHRELPAGTPASWRSAIGRTAGGLIAGAPGLGPGIGGETPAFIEWPDGSEDEVASHEELAATLMDRVDWLSARAREAGVAAAAIERGRTAMVAAIESYVRGGPLTPACLGPAEDERSTVQVMPLARVRWRARLICAWREGVEDGLDAAARANGR